MAANTRPPFTLESNPGTDNATAMATTVTAAANDYTGAGANNVLCFTAGSNGAFLRGIAMVCSGTNVGSVARFFLNNGSANTTASNNQPLSGTGELLLPATTAASAAVNPAPYYPVNRKIKAGYRIYWGLGTAVAAGWRALPDADNY